MERNRKTALEFYDLALTKEITKRHPNTLVPTINSMTRWWETARGIQSVSCDVGKRFSSGAQRSEMRLCGWKLCEYSRAFHPCVEYAALAIFDCFRFDENGKIVEHWDAIQDIPVKAANPNGRF